MVTEINEQPIFFQNAQSLLTQAKFEISFQWQEPFQPHANLLCHPHLSPTYSINTVHTTGRKIVSATDHWRSGLETLKLLKWTNCQYLGFFYGYIWNIQTPMCLCIWQYNFKDIMSGLYLKVHISTIHIYAQITEYTVGLRWCLAHLNLVNTYGRRKTPFSVGLSESSLYYVKYLLSMTQFSGLVLKSVHLYCKFQRPISCI